MNEDKRFSKKRRQRGLTLFELLVVLAILAFLATLVAPRVVGYLGRAKSDIARAQAANIASSLELFFLDYGRYPTEEEGLAALIEKPGESKEWRGPYMKEETALTDPWGRLYLYQPEAGAEAFEIVSLGRDGTEGGDGEDADIRKK